MICENCGNDDFEQQRVTETFHVEGKVVLVEGVPAQVCARCGDTTVSADVGERLRTLVHEPHKPQRVIQAEVLSYEAA